MNTLESTAPATTDAGADTAVPENNVGLAVMATLRNYGIDTIFGIPGTHNLEFYRHLAPLGIHPVTSRHEQGAGYGADGWSQMTGLPGVVITTSGPGLLNALSATATAYCESRPLIVLSPGAPRGSEFSDIGSLHETRDPTGAVAALIGRSTRVASGAEAVEIIHEAFALFAHGRPRPVHIEIPLDLLESAHDVPAEQLAARDLGPARNANDEAVAAAVAVLSQATNPVILAGGGSLRAGSALLALAELLQAPVVTTLNGKGAIPESHPLSLGSDIRLSAAQDLCNGADALLVVGSKVGESELWGGRIAPAGSCIRIDIDPGQLGVNLSADIELVGNSAAVVPALLAALAGHRAAAEADVSDLKASLQAEAREMSPVLARINEILASVLPKDTVIGGDSSQITYFGTASFFPMDSAHQLLYTPCYATLGYGLPASIGAKVAAPDRPVVCLLGDGALMFAVQEFITAVEQRVDLPIICVNNGGYGEIKANMADRGMAPVAVDLTQPDWVKLAEGFGLAAFSVEDLDELGPTVTKAMAVRGPSLIHVTI
ncbi:thiamine pyrophosphate-binding protein [Arthrobacter sp. 35W]|uniref:thiamine pyrophosphate-binding protein n=1 Tax=Arthrobacter sp. 35W TaxID=1132441 RepID=UPI0004209DBA|nr:thiamine pyrophosphate-dependent enzyme [Arthrobacter sp. 35W]